MSKMSKKTNAKRARKTHRKTKRGGTKDAKINDLETKIAKMESELRVKKEELKKLQDENINNGIYGQTDYIEPTNDIYDKEDKLSSMKNSLLETKKRKLRQLEDNEIKKNNFGQSDEIQDLQTEINNFETK
jgi:hypothetical protein